MDAFIHIISASWPHQNTWQKWSQLKVFIYLFFINHGVTALCALINPSVKALNGTFSKWCYAVPLATPKNHWRAAIFCISMVGENNRGEKCFLCCRFIMECLLVGQTFHGDSSASACHDILAPWLLGGTIWHYIKASSHSSDVSTRFFLLGWFWFTWIVSLESRWL